jgi:hypothetical protein
MRNPDNYPNIGGNPHEPIQKGYAEGMAAMLASAKKTKLTTIDPNNDPEIISRVKHTLHKDELLMQWYSRVGLGRAQIMQMGKQEISDFVKQADENQQNMDTTMYAPKPVPKKFNIFNLFD